MFPAARIGDPVTHDSTTPSGMIAPPLVPPDKGVVMIEGQPAAYVTCTVVCSGSTSAGPAHPPPPPGTPPTPIIAGSATVLINGFPAARWAPSGDTAACAALLGDPTLTPTRSVFIGGPPRVAGALLQKAARRIERKRQIAVGKKRAAEMPAGEERDKLVAATTRFEFNVHGAEMALLAENVYRPGKGQPPKQCPIGWKNTSDDPGELKKLGLTQADLEAPGSNYRAQVYKPDPAVFGDDADIKTTVAFKGTDKTSLEDWKNNVQQGTDSESVYYRRAVRAGLRLKDSGADVEITGHSLGGGLASGASRASGAPATTFNASGLHPNTVTHYGGTPIVPKEENINVYQVQGEVLTEAQEHGWLSDRMPDALGKRHPLTAAPGISAIDRHVMDTVIPAIEAQKAEDQATIIQFIDAH